MNYSFIFCFVICLLSMDSTAKIYTCENNGERVFSDIPCQDNKSAKEDYLSLGVLMRNKDVVSIKWDKPKKHYKVNCSSNICECGGVKFVRLNDPIEQFVRSSDKLVARMEAYGIKRLDESAANLLLCDIKVQQKFIEKNYSYAMKKKRFLEGSPLNRASFMAYKCGYPPPENSQGNWTSDRKFIEWFQCKDKADREYKACLLYTSPSPRD